MGKEDIVKRINRGRLLGLKYSEVKNLLIEKGYKDEEINEAILVHFKKANKYSPSKKLMHNLSKQGKKIAKDLSALLSKMPKINIPKVKVPKIKMPKIKLEGSKKKKKEKIKRKYKSPVKKTAKKKVVKRVIIKDPEKYFYFCNEKSAKTMAQFIAIVKKLKDEEFKTHVNSQKNDFSNWISDIIGDKELASKLKSETDKSKILKILKIKN